MFFYKDLANFYKASRIFACQVIRNLLLYWYKCNLLLLSSDIKLNPGTKQNSAKTFLNFHWNLNKVAAHNFAKLDLLKTCSSFHKSELQVCINRLITALQLMLKVCEIQDIILVILIFHQITSLEVFVVIIRVFSLYKLVYWYNLFKQMC